MKDVLLNLNKEVGVKGSMVVTRDGVVVADKAVTKRRLAHDELAALPPATVEATA